MGAEHLKIKSIKSNFQGTKSDFLIDGSQIGVPFIITKLVFFFKRYIVFNLCKRRIGIINCNAIVVSLYTILQKCIHYKHFFLNQ